MDASVIDHQGVGPAPTVDALFMRLVVDIEFVQQPDRHTYENLTFARELIAGAFIVAV
ncbi:hypothetical protein HFO58_32085 [Rhizobium leguminosarum]|nr:hypothetical protein [Rhizobium leguminosarum]